MSLNFIACSTAFKGFKDGCGQQIGCRVVIATDELDALVAAADDLRGQFGPT